MPSSRANELAQQGFAVSWAHAANGETVHINDHVYVSPPWSDRDGTPYIIARILDFLPPGAAKIRGSFKQPKNELHVRLSLYYRPSDVSGRSVSDFRLLLAAIHTSVEPISVVRGRCYVRHKDKIEDLIKWKHTPDHFYFVKFFDPYIKREYEVLRTANVNNIPPHVKEVLLQRYEYLLTEKEMVSDLLDAYKCCAICNQWAASINSVRCELCRQFYHMQCVTPPLLAKPAKGYSWGCMACSMQHRIDVESEKYRFGTNGGSAPPVRGKGSKKEKPVISDKPEVMFRGWPWRYFGLYTTAEDTLNPEDLIYPRAVTRVGTKYQCNVLTVAEQAQAEIKRRADLESGALVAKGIYERGFDPGETKQETTITLISKPSSEHYMETEMKLKMPVPSYDVRRMNEAVESFTAMGADNALKHMQSLKLADFNPIEWTPEETRMFEQMLEVNGGLNAQAASKVLNKRPSEVLRFSYIWKNKKLKTENQLIRQHRKVHIAHARNNRDTLGPPSLGKIRSRAESESSDDEGSLYNASFVATNRMQCAACSTRTSNVWWKCPRTVQGIAMCESCGSNYRKYGVISFVKAEDAKGRQPEKKEPKGKRGAKGDTASGTSTPVPQAAPKLPPCVCCRKMEPKAAMARCKSCTFSVHAGCYGIPRVELGSNWECELCANERNEESNIEPRCMVCPRDNTLLTSRIKSKKQPADFDLLSVLKPTEGCQWAHVLCATWHPEVRYSNSATYKTVEGISTIPDAQWDAACGLCMQTDGATIRCTECEMSVHVSCAWLAGYRLGFEITPAGKREAASTIRFKGESGVMAVGCWCKTHDLSGRVIYDLFEVDPEVGMNALQVFTGAYKAIPATDCFPLLRKAQHLDVVEDRLKANVEAAAAVKAAAVKAAAVKAEAGADPMDVDDAAAPVPWHIAAVDVKPTVLSARSCINCGIDVSARWHTPGTAGADMWVDRAPLPGQPALCHLCWCASPAGVNMLAHAGAGQGQGNGVAAPAVAAA